MVTLRGRPSCIRERSGPTRSVGGWWRSATIRRFCNIRWESPITEARTLRLDYEVTTTTGGPQTLSVRPRPHRRPPASRARGHLGGWGGMRPASHFFGIPWSRETKGAESALVERVATREPTDHWRATRCRGSARGARRPLGPARAVFYVSEPPSSFRGVLR